MIKLPPVLIDRALLLGWIVGLVLAASLLWGLSFSFRAARLMQVTNRALALMNDDRRLAQPMPRQLAGALPLGAWYSLAGPSAESSESAASGATFFVFAIMQNGILVPCGAEISAEGEVIDIIPLGNHARRVLDKIPRGMIQVYSNRIESGLARNREGA